MNEGRSTGSQRAKRRTDFDLNVLLTQVITTVTVPPRGTFKRMKQSVRGWMRVSVQEWKGVLSV